MTRAIALDPATADSEKAVGFGAAADDWSCDP